MATKFPEMKLSGYGSLFGIHDEKRIVNIPIGELHQHPGLHIAVARDAYLDELADSIKKNGIFEEVRAFPDPDGGYWIISGRHRCEAAKLAGLKEVPVILDDSMTREAAEIAITDCNLRHELSIMEKAWTYRIKREAENRQGARTDLHGKPERQDKPTESERTIQRYIRLTYLIDPLQQMVGKKGANALKVRTGEALSYLPEDLQQTIAWKIMETGIVPDMRSAKNWRGMYDNGALTKEYLVEWFSLDQESSPSFTLSLSSRKLSDYLPESCSSEDAEQLIISLLKDWAKGQEGKAQ